MHLHLLDIQATFALTNDFLVLFYWKGMRKEVKRFVQECDACQRNKSETVASPGLSQLTTTFSSYPSLV